MIYLYIYGGIGLVVALWFYLHMRGWAQVGNRMGGAGTLKLFLTLPFVVALWPIAAWALSSDRR